MNGCYAMYRKQIPTAAKFLQWTSILKVFSNYFEFGSAKIQRTNERYNAIDSDTNGFNWTVEHRLIAIFKRFNGICKLKPYYAVFASEICQTILHAKSQLKHQIESDG